MLLGKNTHALLVGMENDRLRKKISPHVYIMSFFILGNFLRLKFLFCLLLVLLCQFFVLFLINIYGKCHFRVIFIIIIIILKYSFSLCPLCSPSLTIFSFRFVFGMGGTSSLYTFSQLQTDSPFLELSGEIIPMDS